MNRLLAAASAALLLTGSLTACSRTTDTTPDTGYTTNKPTRYSVGAQQDRAAYDKRMTTNDSRYDGTPDGRYTAYSDGRVAENPARKEPNSGNTTRNAARSPSRAARDVGDAARDVTQGIGDAVRDAADAVQDLNRRGTDDME